MVAHRRSTQAQNLTVRPDRPLIGIILVEDGEEVVRYFAEDTETATDAGVVDIAGAHSLAGAWADLDWEEAVEALDRIRHESEPTQPIESL